MGIWALLFPEKENKIWNYFLKIDRLVKCFCATEPTFRVIVCKNEYTTEKITNYRLNITNIVGQLFNIVSLCIGQIKIPS